jgi:hypothetical protein
MAEQEDCIKDASGQCMAGLFLKSTDPGMESKWVINSYKDVKTLFQRTFLPESEAKLEALAKAHPDMFYFIRQKSWGDKEYVDFGVRQVVVRVTSQHKENGSWKPPFTSVYHMTSEGVFK